MKGINKKYSSNNSFKSSNSFDNFGVDLNCISSSPRNGNCFVQISYKMIPKDFQSSIDKK